MLVPGTKVKIVKDPKVKPTALLKTLIGKTGTIKGNGAIGTRGYYYSVDFDDDTVLLARVHGDSLQPVNKHGQTAQTEQGNSTKTAKE